MPVYSLKKKIMFLDDHLEGYDLILMFKSVSDMNAESKYLKEKKNSRKNIDKEKLVYKFF